MIAIGLLNVADDHGYFFATAAYIRSQLCPFDESSEKVKAALEELTRLDYIEIRHSKTHGPVGFVKKFSVHQKVEKKGESLIISYFEEAEESFDDESTTSRGTVDDQSTINHRCKGREGNGKETLAPALPPPGGVVDESSPNDEDQPPTDPGPTDEPKPRKRDEIFEALGDLEGGWQRLTDIAKGRVRKALKEIRTATPDVSRPEFDARVSEYRRTMPRAPVTAMAIASNWARLAVDTQASQMNLVSYPADAPIVKDCRSLIAGLGNRASK